jgi:branched-subunit amino acid transport protein AzlD
MILALSSICKITQLISTLPHIIFPATNSQLSLVMSVYNTKLKTFISSILQVKVHNNVKSSVSWDIILFSRMEVDLYFKGTQSFQLQEQALCSGTKLHGATSQETVLYHHSLFSHSSWK